MYLYSHAPNPQVHHSTQAMKGQQATGNCASTQVMRASTLGRGRWSPSFLKHWARSPCRTHRKTRRRLASSPVEPSTRSPPPRRPSDEPGSALAESPHFCTPFVRRLYAVCTLICVHQYDLSTLFVRWFAYISTISVRNVLNLHDVGLKLAQRCTNIPI